LASMKRFQFNKKIYKPNWTSMIPSNTINDLGSILTLCLAASNNIINVSRGSLGSKIHLALQTSTHYHNLH
jgi:hypothetical protein